MNNTTPCWKFLLESIRNDIPSMLLYVLNSTGSSPGRQGFMMAVNKKGAMCGSMGGGIMEHKLVELAKSKLTKQDFSIEVIPQFHHKASKENQSGMICSGEQLNLLYPLRKQDLAIITKWLEKFNTGDTGTLEISQTGMRLVEKTINEDYKLEYKNPHDFTCSIRLGYASTVHIIGGGHCALALSKLMRELGFYVHVYDTRKNLNTFLQNTYAHQKHVLNDYTELAAINEEHRRTYVVIMTFGYRTDEIALRSIINHRFKYVGVLGSKEKMKTLLNNLLQEGISEDLISKIHTPVGLKIYSHTPEEIAVSIAAEIIYTKNKPVTKPS